jgi:HlyD family secretion protein
MRSPSSNPFDAQQEIEENKKSAPLETKEIAESSDIHSGTEELLDALPRVWTRSLLYLLIGFAAAIIPWTMVSHMDETGTARGRIEPQGATQRLDAQSAGNVKAVNVKEGELVKAGQVLVEMESDILQTELQQAQTKLEGLQNRRSQLDVMKNQLMLSIELQEQQNKSQELEKMAQVNQEQQNLDAKQSTYSLQKLEKQALVNQVNQQINSISNDQTSSHNRLKIDSTQVQRFKRLIHDGAVSETQVDQLKKEEEESLRLYKKAQSDLKQAKFHLIEEQNRYQTTMNQLEADIKQAKLRLQEAQSSNQTLIQTGKLAVIKSQEQLKDLQTQIAALQSDIAQTHSQINSIKLQLVQKLVRSPIEGTIYELSVTKSGSVLQPGQMVAQIGPKNAPLILKAQIPSKYSGFLQVGMPVKIKFDAYPYQEYGIVPGTVNWISPDSKMQQTAQGSVDNYELEITIPKPYIQNGDKQIALRPGQTANAEVIVRQRRVIDMVLDPFKKLQKDRL